MKNLKCLTNASNKVPWHPWSQILNKASEGTFPGNGWCSQIKREDQPICFSRASSKLHSGTNKIQILLLKDSRRDLVGVMFFPSVGREGRETSLEIWDGRTHLYTFQKAVAALSFPSGTPNNAQGPGNSAADTPEPFASWSSGMVKTGSELILLPLRNFFLFKWFCNLAAKTNTRGKAECFVSNLSHFVLEKHLPGISHCCASLVADFYFVFGEDL